MPEARGRFFPPRAVFAIAPIELVGNLFENSNKNARILSPACCNWAKPVEHFTTVQSVAAAESFYAGALGLKLSGCCSAQRNESGLRRDAVDKDHVVLSRVFERTADAV